MTLRAKATCITAALATLATFARSGGAAALQHPVRGDQVGESTPSSSTVQILHEELTIDMRRLDAKDGLVRLRAKYRVRNDGPAQTIELARPSPEVRAFRVQGGARDGQRGPGTLQLEPGDSEFEVDFQAAPDVTPRDAVRSFAIDYSLAGAQRWAALGSLTLHVLAPPDWRVLEHPAALAATPQADRYRASFARYPRGKLLVQVQPPLTAHRLLWAVQILLQLATVLLAVWTVRSLRRREQQAGARSPLLLRTLRALGFTVVLLALPLGGLLLHGRLYPYLSDFGTMFTVLVATWCIALGYCWVGHLRRA